MNLFLRAKHWQLFLLTFGIPLLLDIAMMVNIFSHISQNPDPVIMFNYFRFFPLIMVIFMGTLLGWQWSVAIGLQKYLPQGIQMKVTKFKTFFIIPVIYILLILIGITFVFSTHFFGNTSFDTNAAAAFLLIIPIHLFSMFCLIYCLYFVAKTIKTVELQRPVSFSDFVGEFFLVWFFPIGVWILQPRINKIIENPDALGQSVQF